ncbi:MAG: phenylacetate-CoA ligase [Verrucomicrobiota bacterium]
MAPENFPRRQVIVQRQFDQLRDLLRAVLPANKFYAEKYEAAGAPSRVPRMHDFHGHFPLTTKQEFAADQAAHPPYGTNLTVGIENYTRCHQTSGTSGAPIRWLDTPETWDLMIENWSTILRVAGVTPADTVFFAFSFGPFLGFWLAFEAGLRLGCRCLPGGGMTSAARVRAIVDLGASVLCCTPTYAIHLAEVAAREGIDITVPDPSHADAAGPTPASDVEIPRVCPVKIIIVAGEPGGSLPAVREHMSSLWHGARIVDHHGMTEAGPVTLECPARPGVLHVMETDYLPEIIDPATGAQAAAGETGELVLTTLNRTASPLLRYRTGDLVKSSIDTICECGRSDLALEGGILGRTDDMIVVRGVNVYPGAVEEILRGCGGISEYQVKVSQAQSLLELSLTIEPGASETDPEALARRVESALHTALNLRVPVTLAAPGSLPRFEMKASRWVKE